MGKNIAAAKAYRAKEAEINSLYREVKEKGWNIGEIPCVDDTSEEYIAFLTRLRDSEKVIDTGEVRIDVVSGKDCEVVRGRIKIGIRVPIDEIIRFLEE